MICYIINDLICLALSLYLLSSYACLPLLSILVNKDLAFLYGPPVLNSQGSNLGCLLTPDRTSGLLSTQGMVRERAVKVSYSQSY